MGLFLNLRNNPIAFEVTEGSDNELEIPCDYIIEGDTTKLCKNWVAVNLRRKSQKQKLPEAQGKTIHPMYRMCYKPFLLDISYNYCFQSKFRFEKMQFELETKKQCPLSVLRFVRLAE